MSKKLVLVSFLVLAVVGGLVAYGNSSGLMGTFNRIVVSPIAKPCITGYTAEFDTALREFNQSLDDLRDAVTTELYSNAGEEPDYEEMYNRLESEIEDGEIAYDSLVVVYGDIETANDGLKSCL